MHQFMRMLFIAIHFLDIYKPIILVPPIYSIP